MNNDEQPTKRRFGYLIGLLLILGLGGATVVAANRGHATDVAEASTRPTPTASASAAPTASTSPSATGVATEQSSGPATFIWCKQIGSNPMRLGKFRLGQQFNGKTVTGCPQGFVRVAAPKTKSTQTVKSTSTRVTVKPKTTAKATPKPTSKPAGKPCPTYYAPAVNGVSDGSLNTSDPDWARCWGGFVLGEIVPDAIVSCKAVGTTGMLWEYTVHVKIVGGHYGGVSFYPIYIHRIQGLTRDQMNDPSMHVRGSTDVTYSAWNGAIGAFGYPADWSTDGLPMNCG